MNVSVFGSKDDFDAHRPRVKGVGHLAVPSQPNDPILGTWKWLLDEQRHVEGVVEFKPDGTFVMVGAGKLGIWKLNDNHSYTVQWISIGSEDTVSLSGNGLAGKNQSGRPVFGERMQPVAVAAATPTAPASAPLVVQTPAPVVPPVPVATAPPAAAELKPVIRSIEELLSGVDTSKPMKPYDRVDSEVIRQMNKDFHVTEGREIEIEIQLGEPPKRYTDTQFQWQSAPVKSATNTFTPVLTVNLPPDAVAIALAPVPGKTAILHGTIKRCTVGYGGGPLVYLAIDASSLKVKETGVVASSSVASTAPATVQSAAPSSTEQRKSVQLDRGWDTPMQGGSQTMNDLARLFGSLTKPKEDLTATIDAPIYDQITYLIPARQAIESLKLNVRAPSKVLVACPGFPRGSLYYYALDGRFEGYNRLYLVVDRADQVLSVELVNETSTKAEARRKADPSWRTYDFVNARSRASNILAVEHKIGLATSSVFEESHRTGEFAPQITDKNANWKIARVDSSLVEVDKYGFPTTAKQQTRWYVPRPLVELILTCVQKVGTR